MPGKRLAREWSAGEDLRPGVRFNAHQPERTVFGKVWTQMVTFDWTITPTQTIQSFTQMTITERCDGSLAVGHGRIYAPTPEDDCA